MNEVTRILERVENGELHAAESLLPLVYEELKELASARLVHEKPGNTMQPTALVHEAYVRLVDSRDAQQWNSRGHFFAAAAESMRRIMVERARAKGRIKRGGARKRVDLESIQVASDAVPDDLIALDEAMELLATEHPDCASLVKLRFFAGMGQSEAAAALGIPRRSADRKWAFARAWLHQRLASPKGDD